MDAALAIAEVAGHVQQVVDMAGEKLTKRVVDGLKAPEPSKVGGQGSGEFRVGRELRGFGVQVMPSGIKGFVIQYRMPGGRPRRVVIGRYGLMTAVEARTLAHEKLVAVSKGVDPVAEEAKAAGLLTVAEICDWYFAEAEASRILGRRRRAIKASTLAMDRSRIESHIKPLLGKRQVGSLKLGDIEGAQADIAAGKTSKARVGSRGGATTGGEGVAARTISTLHSIFEHAVRLGQIEANPAKGVRKLSSTPRERRLSRVEIERLADITPHTLRHTFASPAGDLGLYELTIAALLGHSARGVTSATSISTRRSE